MARTVNEIYQTILDAKAAQPALSELNSPSQTAIWRLWAFVVATCQWLVERLWDEFRAETEAFATRSVAGTAPWYKEKALEFQWNAGTTYFVTFDENHRVVWNETVPEDRIVKYASVVESGNGMVLVKVAKDAGGTPVPLASAELASFSDYMHTVKFAGTRMQSVSYNADKLRVYGAVYYDPISNLNVVKSEVERSINAYLSSLPFDGKVYVERIFDAVQKVKGVVSFRLTRVAADPGDVAVYDLASGVNLRFWPTLAGYVVPDSANPLSATISYHPSNT